MKKTLVSVIFPIVFLLGWLATLQINATSGQIVRLKIGGYDPRDILAGHFIRYSFIMDGWFPCSDHSNSEACVCLAPAADPRFHQVLWGGACSSIPGECLTILRASCNGVSFASELGRYSIPEEFAPVLRQVPDDSSVVIAIDSSHRGQTVKFLVGEEELYDFARKQLANMTPTPKSTGLP